MDDERDAVDKLRSELDSAIEEQGAPLKAADLLQRVEQLDRSVYTGSLVLKLLDAKVRLFMKLDRPGEALDSLNEIEKGCKESGMTVVPGLLDTKARLLAWLNRPEEALDSLKAAERIYKATGDLKGMANNLEFRIEILTKLGRVHEWVLQVGRMITARDVGEMPSDGGLPPDYWKEQ